MLRCMTIEAINSIEAQRQSLNLLRGRCCVNSNPCSALPGLIGRLRGRLFMSEEQWKTIPGWDQYMVSDLGRVKRIPGWDAKGRYRIKGGLIKPVPVKLATDPRYRPLCVSLSAGGRALCIKVAILVLLAFRGQPTKEKNCARHLDDNQENNQLINLAWGSQKDNAEDRIRNGKTSPGAKNGNSKITEEQATNIIQELKQTFKY